MTTRLPSDGEHYFLGTLEENSTLFHDQSANTFIIQSNPTGTLTDIFAFDGNGITLTPVTDVLVPLNTGMVIGHTEGILGNGIGEATANEFQVLGTLASASSITIGRFSANAQEAFLVFMKSYNNTVGTNTIVQDNNRVGSIVWLAADGTDFLTETARFTAEVDDASPEANGVGMAFVWYQQPGGGTTAGQESLRISAARNMTLGSNVAHGTTAGTLIQSYFEGTAPAGTLANGASIFADVVSSDEVLRGIDSAGNVTTL